MVLEGWGFGAPLHLFERVFEERERERERELDIYIYAIEACGALGVHQNLPPWGPRMYREHADIMELTPRQALTRIESCGSLCSTLKAFKATTCWNLPPVRYLQPKDNLLVHVGFQILPRS